MGHVLGMAYFSIVIPYMIFREWQLLSFFHNNLSYGTCAEKAYDWRIDEIPDFHLTCRRAWLYDLLKISQVAIERCVKPVESSDNASCQIHHFCDAGAVSDLCLVDKLGQVYLLFFIGKSCLAPFFKENNHP